jgi:hypothetical protein
MCFAGHDEDDNRQARYQDVIGWLITVEKAPYGVLDRHKLETRGKPVGHRHHADAVRRDEGC